MQQGTRKSKPSKHIRLTLEPHPTRETDAYQAMLSRRMHVRYMKNLLNFKQTLVSSDCNPQECPMMRQRFQQHVNARRSAPSSSMQCPPVLQASDYMDKLREQSIAAVPSLSRSRVPKFRRPQLKGAHSVQTNLTSADMDLLDYNAFKNIKKNKPDTASSSETKSVTADRSYKDLLYDIITDWLQELPIVRINNPKNGKLQENLINNLIDNIQNVSFHDDYENQIKMKIDECLQLLLKWSSGVDRDLKVMEESSNKLWLKIRKVYNKHIISLQEKNKTNTEVALKSQDQNIRTVNSLTNTDSKYNLIIDLESSIEKEIIEWLNKNLMETRINHFHIAELMIRRLEPLLNEINNPKYKLMVKREILEVLYDLSFCSIDSRNRMVFLNKCAEELSNKVLSLQRTSLKVENVDLNYSIYQYPNVRRISNSNRLPIISLSNTKKVFLEDIEEDISCVSTEVDDHISTDKVIDDVLQQLCGTACNTFDNSLSKTQLSGSISIYTSQEQPVTSTPKQNVRKNISKLNAEEIAYMDKVAQLIRSWIDTLPKQYNEDKNYKETIIFDLAGDIMDEVKVKQLAPDGKSDNDKYLDYLVRRWLYRFDFFHDMRKAKPEISDFIAKFKKLPVPKLTRPQHGSRQAMQNIKHMESEMRHDDFVPQGIDILEDQISVWMNEQPSEIYKNNDKGNRRKQIHNLAMTLQDRLRSKSPDSEIENDINQWLNHIIKPKEREHVGILTENLKEKIIHSPQDETLEARLQERKRYRQDYLEARRNPPPKPSEHQTYERNVQDDPDKTMQQFISKFMEYNYDIDDPMAREAFSYLLKNELRKLIPLTRQEVYENLRKSEHGNKFPPSNLSKELEYIVMISDWLNNIPIAASYNTVGNKQRIDFVNDLAKNIAEIENSRLENPNEMDYNMLLASVISHSMLTYELPLDKNHRANENQMINQLLYKIEAGRTHIGSISSGNDSSISFDTGIVPEHELGQFIEQYVRLNGREIADDEVKLEAWSARLMKEIKKMVQDNENPNIFHKVQIYDKFADVSIPGEESVRRFGLELEYIKEISEWLKNFPLVPISNQPDVHQERVQMISNLAEKITENTVKKAENPNDTSADNNTVEYLTNWISRLPLDPQYPVVLPIIIQQLLNRIDRVNQKNQPEKAQTFQESVKSVGKSPKTCHKDSKMPCCSDVKSLPDPGKHIVETIENWCDKLPIEGDKDSIKVMKDNIAKSIYQKLSELNVDPRIFNDDILYREMLEDEIDTQLENIPLNDELIEKREALKTKILDTIIKAKNIAKAKSAGENYKHKLEKTIDVSIPSPLSTRQNIDPGFEIYKSHLANMFILENFDHGNDEIKIEYEKQIRNEIDKYFVHAQKKNAKPLSKDEIYNELYSVLFNVPVPCGKMIANEVEEIKTRCEIETWFEHLPLQEANGLQEMLDRDKIIETLAKRIYNIEKIETKPNEKVHKEIIKWLRQLPFLPKQEGNFERFANNLQEKLNSTTSARKCVTAESKDQNKPKPKLNNTQATHGTSQIAGPSSAGQNWVSPPKRRKPAQHIIELVEEWCEKLPIISSTEDVNGIRDNITTKLIMRISELNSSPEYLDSELFDEELENILQNLPASPDFKRSIPARKYQLKEMLKSSNPLLKDEKQRYEYKEELKNKILNVLEEPQNTTEEKITIFNDLKSEIVENFVQYNYDKGDKARQIYKNNVHDAVIKYLLNFKDKNSAKNIIMDPLIMRNQLLCELAKVPIPNASAINEEVEVIRMNKEVEQFFNEIPIPKNYNKKLALLKQIKVKLSKTLDEIERSGHNNQIDQKMKSEISRCMEKIGVEVKPEVIDAFVSKLKATESARKSHPDRLIIQDLDEARYKSFRAGVSMNSSIAPQIQAGVPHPSPARVPFNQSVVYQDPDEDTPSVIPNAEYFDNRPKRLFDQHSPYPSDVIDRSIGASDVTYDNAYYKNGNRRSAQGPWEFEQDQQQAIPGRIPVAGSVPPTPYNSIQSTGGTPSSLFRGPQSDSIQDANGSITPSSLFLPPNMSQMGNFSQFNLREFDQSTIPNVNTGQAGRPLAGDPNAEASDSEEGVCPCVKRTLRNCRGRPFCMPMIDEYCEDCGGFGPMWWGMCPGFMFY